MKFFLSIGIFLVGLLVTVGCGARPDFYSVNVAGLASQTQASEDEVQGADSEDGDGSSALAECKPFEVRGCLPGERKFEICHHHGAGKVSIVVSIHAIAAHLRRGDTCGHCPR